MIRAVPQLSIFLSSLMVCAFAQAYPYEQGFSWSDGFYPKYPNMTIPAPDSECQVCFFESPFFQGERFCVGQRSESCTDVSTIVAPTTIGSIQFTARTQQCHLVTNIRVLVPPYDQRIDSFSSDVNDTAYEGVVQELFVEPAGRACFLAAREIERYGRCYESDEEQVEAEYQEAFYEVLMFKDDQHDFDVIIYSGTHFNGASDDCNEPSDRQRGRHRPDDKLIKKRLGESSSNFSVPEHRAGKGEGGVSTLLYNIRSIRFVNETKTSDLLR